jgi:pimeloyl-ACP methyl ester carboxylesterase
MLPIAWTPATIPLRDGASHPAEQGELLVPETPRGASITLRFLRMRSPRPAAPVALFLAGGPGDSGMQWARHPPFFRAFDLVRAEADLILLDQRGCGSSERDLRMTPPDQLAPDALATEEAMREFTLDHLRANAERLRADGAPPEAYTALASAADLDLLRQALGLERWSLWGYSYGTHLAQAYAKLFAGRLDRMVLCGFEGPDMTFKLPSRIQAQLERIHAWAESHGHGGFLDDLRAVHARLDREPMRAHVRLTGDGPSSEVRVGAFALRHVAAAWCGVSNRYPRLPGLYRALASGDGAPLEDALADLARSWTRPLTYFLKDAASGASPARLARIRAEAPACDLREAVNFPHPDAGAAIGAADLGEAFRAPLVSDLPILVLTGSMDGFTPTENAMEGLAHLPNAAHRVVRGAAHNDLIASPAAVDAIARFLGEGAPPAEDAFSIEPPALASDRNA